MTPAILTPAPHDTRVPDINPKKWKQPQSRAGQWCFVNDIGWIFV